MKLITQRSVPPGPQDKPGIYVVVNAGPGDTHLEELPVHVLVNEKAQSIARADVERLGTNEKHVLCTAIGDALHAEAYTT